MRMTASVIHGYTKPRAGVGRGGGGAQQQQQQGPPSVGVMFLLQLLQAQQAYDAEQVQPQGGAFIEEGDQGNGDGTSN